MKILVTGEAGFIGSNVVDAYIEKGYEVIVVDDLSSGKKENLNKKAKFYKLDICDKALEEVFEEGIALKPLISNVSVANFLFHIIPFHGSFCFLPIFLPWFF